MKNKASQQGAITYLMLSLLSSFLVNKVYADTTIHANEVASWQHLPSSIQSYYQLSNASNQMALSEHDITAMRHWQDNNGHNYVLQFKRSKGEERFDNNNDVKNELISHLYVINAQGVRRLWQIYDFAEPCALDVIADYTDNPIVVSDVNHNGIAEVAISYYLGCRGDVGYDYMKVIMYEGQQKFAIRGSSSICNAHSRKPLDNNTNHYGGDYEIDEALFKKAKSLSGADKRLFTEQLHSVWQQNQCSYYFYPEFLN